MNSDIAALVMGLAAAAVFIGYRIRRRARREKEKEEWLDTFRKSAHVVPEVKHIITVRIDG